MSAISPMMKVGGGRPIAQESIESTLLARQAAVEDAWVTPETDVTLLRSELAACRDEIARLRGGAKVRDAALDLVVHRLSNWVKDNPPRATITVDLVEELLGDMNEAIDAVVVRLRSGGDA